MEPVKNLVRRGRDRVRNRVANGTELAELTRRVAQLEAEVQECRQLNLRLAELTDVVMELLLPVADRDQETVERILERYRNDALDPERWRS